MERNSVLYQQYTGILREELVPAMGCTEPISIAYAAAKCRALLGCEPERCVLEVSSSIIKNVKSVIPAVEKGLKPLLPPASSAVMKPHSCRCLPTCSRRKSTGLRIILKQPPFS